MSASPPASVAAVSRDALRASASTSVAPITASSATAATSPAAPLPIAEHELAAVKQQIVALQPKIDAAEKRRDARSEDDPLWIRADDELKQLRDEKALLLKKEERLHDELKRKELPVAQPSITAPAVEQLAQQFSSLVTIINERDKVIAEQQKLLKRVMLQPPVEIRSFNSSDHFQAISYRTLGELFLQTYRHFNIDVTRLGDGMRFYWLPALKQGASIGERLEKRRTLRNEADWERFLDEWNEEHNSRLIVLYFVTGELSPSLVQCPLPPSPPRMPLDHAEEKSEPASDHGLSARDSAQCVVCGHSDHVEAAHVIDKSRAELLSGAPDAPPIDDLRNLFQLCPNHHTSFDRYEWTLVEERRSEEGVGFWLRPTPALQRPSADLSALMQTFIRFREPSPPAYSFLLKQLGRFPVPCRVCAQPFVASAIWGHYNGQHKDRRDEWKDKPHLLPRITGCACEDRGDTAWALYCHVLDKHRELLYS